MGIIRTGRVTGSEIKKNKDGEKNVLMLQVEITEPDDVQSIQLMKQAGEDTNPSLDSQVVILSIGEAFKIAVASDDGVEPSMDPGEKKLYSVSGGAIAAFINFLASGILELNGNTDFAVRFNELEAAFNEHKDDYNDFLSSVFKLHKHGGVTIGSGSSAVPDNAASAVPTEADISPAKIDTIKVPGA